MHLVYINYGPYSGASGVHIHFIANEMIKLGYKCTVVLPELTNNNYFGVPQYSFSTYDKFLEDAKNGKYGKNTVLHAWTPREVVRIVTTEAAKIIGAPWFVHLEDNERRILEKYSGLSFQEIINAYLNNKLKVGIGYSHPLHHQTFLAEAAGVSVLMDKLEEFVPSNVPSQLIWPACEADFFQLPQNANHDRFEKFNFPPDARLIVYPGNLHRAVAETVFPLYKALPLIEEAGFPIRLLRLCGFDNVIHNDLKEIYDKHILYLRNVPSKKLPHFIGMADVLVQPGIPDAFDEYRFPSKLPYFLASGRPVILAKTNLGRFLTDNENCILLDENTPEAIAEKVIHLFKNPNEALRIGHNGRKFAAANFNWAKTAKQLIEFYKKCGMPC